MTLRIENKSCIACGKCVQVCPAGIMVRSTDGKGIEAVRTDRCIGCGHCVDVCPTGSVIHSDFPPQRVHTVDTSRLPAPEQVLELIRLAALEPRADAAPHTRRSPATDRRSGTLRPHGLELPAGLLHARHRARTTAPHRRLHRRRLRLDGTQTAASGGTNVAQTFAPRPLPLCRRASPRSNANTKPAMTRILRRATALLIIHTPASNRFGCEDANLAYQNASLMAESLGVSQIYMGFVLTAARMGRKNAFARIAGITAARRRSWRWAYPRSAIRNTRRGDGQAMQSSHFQTTAQPTP